MDRQLFVLLKRMTIALPIIVGIYGAAINIGQSKQLICKRLAIRALSCYHQSVYLFGLATSTGEPFRVQAAVVEEYHPNLENRSYTAYRLALTGSTGKDFFYYENNVQQAYSDLKLLNHLLSGSGALSSELRYARPSIDDILLLVGQSLFACSGIILLRVLIVAILFIPVAISGKGLIKSIIKSIVIPLLVLTISVTLWGMATILQSEQLHCKLAGSDVVHCEHRITYLFGTWSILSKFNVQRAVVKEDYSSSRAEPSYNLFLTTSEGREICYACYNLGVHQVYSNLNQLNAILNIRGVLTLDLNYEQSWSTQLLALIGGLTVVPLELLMMEVCFVAPIFALIGIFIPARESRSGCDLP